MKIFFIAFGVIIVIAIGSYFFMDFSTEEVAKAPTSATPGATNQPSATEVTPEPTVEPEPEKPKTETVIGTSVEKREIKAYHYGKGDKEILFIGGIHGGYSWNTALLAYELMAYLKANPSVVPEEVKVTIIPVLNPDGLFKVAGKIEGFTKADVSTAQTTLVSGRFNANEVDLNRNFDCDWKASGTWQNKAVSGGAKTFSEPESQAIKTYAEANDLTAVVTWYSSAGGVFASSCHNDILPETLELTKAFAKASGYKAYEEFDFYAISGDMVNWFAKNSTPAISVLLSNHTDTEWEKNRAGVEAILKYYAE